MPERLRLTLATASAALLAGILSITSVEALDIKHGAPAPETPPDEMVLTHGQTVVAGKPLRYTVRTGYIPICDDVTGDLVARMFIIAYSADTPGGAPRRPLTFVWNGGPGANSSESHLLGFGPQGYVVPTTFPEYASPPSQIAERPETLLASSDLVFVDPVGTGYSRATSEANKDILYTTNGDAEAVAEMIRVYRTRYDAFDRPLFISGESYGTTRAMEVAWALARRRTPLTGVILISGFFDVGQKVPKALEEALNVQLFAATAHYFKRLSPDLLSLSRDEAVAKALAWARSEYAPALAANETLSADQRAKIIADLAHYSGLDPRFINPKSLVVTKSDYLDHLLDDRGLELGRYDSRMTIARRDLATTPWLPTRDPSLIPLLDMMQGTSPSEIRYLRDTLGFKSDLLYKGPFGEGFHPTLRKDMAPGISDDWMAINWDRANKASAFAPQAEPRENSPTQAQEAHASTPSPARPPQEAALRRALEADPKLRVLNVRGLFDESCATLDENVAASDPALRGRIEVRCYPSGHAIYTDAQVRVEYQHDFADFERRAVAAQ